MKDLHSPVSIHGERDLSQDIQVAVDKFAQALVIFDCSIPRTPTDEQLKPRDTKCILNINPNQKNLEPVAGSRGDLVVAGPIEPLERRAPGKEHAIPAQRTLDYSAAVKVTVT